MNHLFLTLATCEHRFIKCIARGLENRKGLLLYRVNWEELIQSALGLDRDRISSVENAFYAFIIHECHHFDDLFDEQEARNTAFGSTFMHAFVVTALRTTIIIMSG